MLGVIYFLVLPEIRSYPLRNPEDSARTLAEMVLKTLKPEEERVIKVLAVHGGLYLQKYLTKEAGLSKLKTHRIVARLSERRIVHISKRGNTNEVLLVKWLLDAMKG